ncbi:MAG: hypothetical protein ACO3YZ_03600 [Candidatus Nanopelagicaceae bacterium]
MDFQKFVEIVATHFPSAEWGFQDHGEVSPHYHPGKRYYTWQEGFSCAAYDEREPSEQKWLVECGRGSQGRGATIEAALAAEEQNYQPNCYRE